MWLLAIPRRPRRRPGGTNTWHGITGRVLLSGVHIPFCLADDNSNRELAIL